jgi:hypothetical protein
MSRAERRHDRDMRAETWGAKGGATVARQQRPPELLAVDRRVSWHFGPAMT